MSGIISGQDTLLQIGLAKTWKTPSKAKYRVPYLSENFKGTPNYKEGEALVGAKTTTNMAIMSMKADGGFRTYLPPDLAKFLFYCALGRELARTQDGGQEVHKYVPIPSGACRNMPGITAEVDRIFEKGLYYNFKINNLTISASQEDYAYAELDGPAYAENLQDALLRGQIKTWTVGTKTIVVDDGLIAADGLFVGKIFRAYKACAEILLKITASTAAANSFVIEGFPEAATVPGAADIDNTWSFEVLDWVMTPGLALSDLEWLRFAHARLTIEGSMADLVVRGAIGDGRANETVLAVPVAVDCKDVLLTVEARNSRGEPCIYRLKSQAAAIVHTGTLTFKDSGMVGAQIPSIHLADGSFNDAQWSLVEELYDEASDVKITFGNGMKDGRFGADGSLYQKEVNPTAREFTVEATMDFSKRYSELRRKKMLSGATVKISVEFITTVSDIDGPYNTSIDSTGKPYRVVINFPSCYHIDGIPNIGGPDAPTVSAKFKAREIVGVSEAVEVLIYDDVAADIATEEVARVDGL